MTKTTISFVTSSEDSGIYIMSDDDRNVDSLGNKKTSFVYGDTAYFRVYAENPDEVAVCSTDGTVTAAGVFTEEVEDEAVTFISSSSAQPEKPVFAVNSYAWAGKSLGVLSRSGVFSVACSVAPDTATGLIGTALVSYRTAYKLFGITLSAKSYDEYPVTVWAGLKNG